MRTPFSYLTLLVLLTAGLSAEETTVTTNSDNKIIAIEVNEDFNLQAVNKAKLENTLEKHNTYVQAYLQGCLDSKFPQSGTVVTVRNGDVILSSLPENKDRAKRLVEYVQNFVDNSTVENVTGMHVVQERTQEDAVVLQGRKCNGMWLPQSTILYPSEVANPRQVSFSCALRFRDSVAGQLSTPVSFGDQFPLYRWSNYDLFSTYGDLQLEIEGAVFSIFNQTKYSSPLLNADYYVALPLTYAHDKFAHRLRLYHISSHLGDEYLVEKKCNVSRFNKSFEALDYSLAYNITNQIRVYGTAGFIAHSDSEMHLKKQYVQYGMEVRAGRHEWKQLFGTPYLAMHFENWQDNDWKINATFALGYEWGKLNGLGKKIRTSLEYHSGFSDQGQFSRRHDDYFQIRLSYGF